LSPGVPYILLTFSKERLDDSYRKKKTKIAPKRLQPAKTYP
jgi:hypothetical protein